LKTIFCPVLNLSDSPCIQHIFPRIIFFHLEEITEDEHDIGLYNQECHGEIEYRTTYAMNKDKEYFLLRINGEYSQLFMKMLKKNTGINKKIIIKKKKGCKIHENKSFHFCLAEYLYYMQL